MRTHDAHDAHTCAARHSHTHAHTPRLDSLNGKESRHGHGYGLGVRGQRASGSRLFGAICAHWCNLSFISSHFLPFLAFPVSRAAVLLGVSGRTNTLNPSQTPTEPTPCTLETLPNPAQFLPHSPELCWRGDFFAYPLKGPNFDSNAFRPLT